MQAKRLLRRISKQNWELESLQSKRLQLPTLFKERQQKKLMPNSRQKGVRGERMWRDVLREEGFTARRGQQFCGGSDSPDVVCDELKHLHMEVKFVEKLNLDNACNQAGKDAGSRPWIVAHKRSRTDWKVTMDSETFFALLRDGMDGLRVIYEQAEKARDTQ